MPRMKRNFVIKTIDGRGGAVQKALKAAGIEVLSVIEVYKEALPEAETPDAGTAAAGAAEQTSKAGAPRPPDGSGEGT